MHLFRTISLAPICLQLSACNRFISRQFSPRSSSMSRSGNGSGANYCGGRRASRPASNFAPRSVSVGEVEPKEEGGSRMYSNRQPVSSSTHEQNLLSSTERNEQGRSSASVAGIVSEKSESVSIFDSNYDEEFPPLGANSNKRRSRIDLRSREKRRDVGLSRLKIKNSPIESSTGQLDGSSLPSQFRKKSMPANAVASVSSGSKDKCFSKRRVRLDLRSEEKVYDVGSNKNESFGMENFTCRQDGYSLPSQFGKGKAQKPTNDNGSAKNSWSSESFPMVKPFDICFRGHVRSTVLESSLHFEDGGTLNGTENSMEGATRRVLRPGMVLLKNYLTHSEQIRIVKYCQKLGLGPGGFYQPGYKDGAKLRLQMMCLGKDWDPQTKTYQDRRSVDGCEPPGIPGEFIWLVKRAIQDAHALISKDSRVSNAEDILPAMSPDICIVNFYTTSGKLGLHQDRDESRKSIRKGLPVVSFSVGDSAEFLYGDERDIDKAEEVILESGDVVIFGGESRHIFHGVPCIIPNSAPEELLRDAKLRPGRLNLTFRQY